MRLNLENRGNGVCEACGAIGELDRKTIINIGLKALELGYHTLTSKALKGDKVTGLLTLMYSDDDFDYYKANILEIAARLGIEVR